MNENLANGLELLGIGMSVVLSFLMILVIFMGVMTGAVRQLNRLFPETVEGVKNSAQKVSANVDEAIALAIAAVKAGRS